jgi:hypothetical protein
MDLQELLRIVRVHEGQELKISRVPCADLGDGLGGYRSRTLGSEEVRRLMPVPDDTRAARIGNLSRKLWPGQPARARTKQGNESRSLVIVPGIHG